MSRTNYSQKVYTCNKLHQLLKKMEQKTKTEIHGRKTKSPFVSPVVVRCGAASRPETRCTAPHLPKRTHSNKNNYGINKISPKPTKKHTGGVWFQSFFFTVSMQYNGIRQYYGVLALKVFGCPLENTVLNTMV